MVFIRDPGTGALTQKAGTAGCVSETGTGGDCADGKALGDPVSVTVSPDDGNVYAASNSVVAVFDRDPGSGALTQKAGTAGCVSETGTGGECADGKALGGASGGGTQSVTVSPDGSSAYVSSDSQAVAIFDRDPVSGSLSQQVGTAGCIGEQSMFGACADGKALSGASSVAVSADGSSAYVASDSSHAVAIFDRESPAGRDPARHCDRHGPVRPDQRRHPHFHVPLHGGRLDVHVPDRRRRVRCLQLRLVYQRSAPGRRSHLRGEGDRRGGQRGPKPGQPQLHGRYEPAAAPTATAAGPVRSAAPGECHDAGDRPLAWPLSLQSGRLGEFAGQPGVRVRSGCAAAGRPTRANSRPPTIITVVAKTQIYEPVEADDGLQFACRVTARNAAGTTAATSPSTLLTQLGIPLQSPRCRGTSAFAASTCSRRSRNSGSQTFGFPGPFASLPGGGTPTSFIGVPAALAPGTTAQRTDYVGASIDAGKPATAIVYVDSTEAGTAVDQQLEVTLIARRDGRQIGNTTLATTIPTPPRTSTAWVTTAERDDPKFGVQFKIPRDLADRAGHSRRGVRARGEGRVPGRHVAVCGQGMRARRRRLRRRQHVPAEQHPVAEPHPAQRAQRRAARL